MPATLPETYGKQGLIAHLFWRSGSSPSENRPAAFGLRLCEITGDNSHKIVQI